MQLKRRQFLKYCIGSAASLGLPLTVVGKLEKALAADGSNPPTVIWLNGSNCTGCTVSLANRFSSQGPTDIADLLTGYINLAFHPNLMGAAGDLAVEQLNAAADGDYILVVDGGIPTAFNGHACMLYTEDGREYTAMEVVRSLAGQAAAILSVGTCASYGGVPAASSNPTGVVSVSELIGRPTINIPGCPAHPDWIVWTVANLLAGVVPRLDRFGRPMDLFGSESKIVHKACPRRESDETKQFGVEGRCLKELGCKGPQTFADCPTRKWNNRTNWCIGANAICIGCTESEFPDKFSPFYKVEYSYDNYQKAPPDPNPEPNPDPDPNPDPQPEPKNLVIETAEWVAERRELRVQGTAAGGAIVTVRNADSSALLGAVSADGEGKWRLRHGSPSPVPRRVRAQTAASVAEKDVKNAPGTVAAEPEAVRIEEAKWEKDRRQLMVKGKGTRGRSVLIANARTGERLGTVTVDSEGKWRFTKSRLSSAPCRVLAESGNSSSERAVGDAPSNCR